MKFVNKKHTALEELLPAMLFTHQC